MAKKKVPEIRFKGFEGEWEEKELGDITIPFSDPVSTPHDGYWRLGIRSHAKGTFHEYVSAGKELETATMHKVRSDNLIVNITFAWEHAVAITDSDDADKLVSHRFPQYGFNKDMVPLFFKFLILDKRFRYHLWLSSPGGAGRNRVLKTHEMLEYVFKVPNSSEQKEISTFLINLDSLIALHQRKHDKLLTVKKAMLEKMFPKEDADVPEIRFKGFAGRWIEQKWENTVDISTNMVDPRNSKYDELIHIGPGNIESFTGRLLDNVSNIKDSDFISGKFLFNSGDIIYGKIRPQLAKYTIAPCTGLTSADAYVLNAKNDLAQNFLYTILQTFNFYNYSVSVSARTGMPKINRDELNAYSFLSPDRIEEQLRIADFFQRLDSLISLHARELDKLRNIKKACLEKMFV